MVPAGEMYTSTRHIETSFQSGDLCPTAPYATFQVCKINSQITLKGLWSISRGFPTYIEYAINPQDWSCRPPSSAFWCWTNWTAFPFYVASLSSSLLLCLIYVYNVMPNSAPFNFSRNRSPLPTLIYISVRRSHVCDSLDASHHLSAWARGSHCCCRQRPVPYVTFNSTMYLCVCVN